MSESSNSTRSWVPPICISENWSNENALAVLFALAIGCLAHPPGSLAFNKSGRIWRLSPHLGLVEAFNLVCELFVARMSGYSFHLACVTLLAVRAGNCWTATEYESFQEEWGKEQGEIKERATLPGLEKRGDDEMPRDGVEEVIPSVGRSTTIEAEEGRANVHRRTTQVAELHSAEEIKRKGKINPQTSPDIIFRAQLEETERYEKGLTFRILVWVPMLLAAAKMSAVNGGWYIWGPRCASRHQLSEDEREKALNLSRQWRKTWSLRAERQKTIEDALVSPSLVFLCFEEVGGGFILGRIACTILLGFNAWPLVAQTAGSYFFPYWKYSSWLDSFLWQPDWSDFRRMCMIPPELFILSIFVFSPFFFYASFYLGLVYLSISPWALVLLNILPAVLFLRWGTPVRNFRDSLSWQALKMNDMDRLVPGYLALLQAILMVLRYTRVLNDYASYDCSTTTVAPWFNWTL